MQAIAVANHKGGVGKTTVTRNIAPVLASRRRVLCVDMDPQGALTRSLGIELGASDLTIADAITWAAPAAHAIVDISPRLSLLPADRRLAEAELTIAGRSGREEALRRALATLGDRYDLALIDAPPTLGLLMVNTLIASDGVLIPTRPNTQDLHALRDFLATIDALSATTRHDVQALGIVANEYDTRAALHADALAAMRGAGLKVLGTIGRSVRVAEASGAAQSIADYDAGNPRAAEFKRIAKDVDRWLKRHPKQR
jgi:chromosome partitioning protein